MRLHGMVLSLKEKHRDNFTFTLSKPGHRLRDRHGMEQITAWSRVLLEKLTFSYLDMEFPTFYKLRISLSYLQDFATRPCPERVESSPFTHIPLKICFNIILVLFLGLESASCLTIWDNAFK
jgi:hypothetical protein